MKLETPFIALMIASLFFTSFFTVFIGVAEEYDVNYDLDVMNVQNNGTTVQEAFDEINRTKTEMDLVTDEFENTLLEEKESLFPFWSMAKQIGTTIYRSLNIFKELMTIFIQIIGIPDSFMVVFFAILSTVFALVVVFILIGRST